MHIPDEQPLEVICKGEQVMGKAKEVAEHIEEEVRRILGEQPDRSRQAAERGQSPTVTPEGWLKAGSAIR